jgi:hypothetical protein
VAPFLLLLPRAAKRSPRALGAAAALLLAMHYVDLYWLVMPAEGAGGAPFTWIDLAGLLGPAGAGALALALRATRSPIYPLKDPRLPEALAVQNP